MKQKYLRKVKNALPRKLRAQVLRDLEEIFASAAEHGETEEQVIERLGCPCNFVKEAALQLGVDLEKRKIRRFTAAGITAVIVAVIFGISYLRIRMLQSEAASIGIIGGADGPTAILISGPGIDLTGLFLAVTVVAVIIALLFLSKILKKKK